MVLITNRQSNILQDIDSLHLFAQVVSSICKSLDEREILRNAYELLSAFDEIISLGYRENLSLSQIKTFLEMESHEERIQEIISRVCLPRLSLLTLLSGMHRTKNLKLQKSERERPNSSNSRGRKCHEVAEEMYPVPRHTRHTLRLPARLPKAHMIAMKRRRTNLSSKPGITSNGGFHADHCRSTAAKGKGMQLGKKSKTTDMFERVRGDLGPDADSSAPLIQNQTTTNAEKAPTEASRTSLDKDSIQVVVSEAISAKFDKEGTMKSLGVKGDLQLRISDPSFARVKLDLTANPTHNAQFKTHPNVDKGHFSSSKGIQLKDTSKSFPANTPVGVLRWNANIPADSSSLAPITFTVWVNKGSDDNYTLTVEYELTGSDTLTGVVVTIPYRTSEPSVSSFDAVYEVSGDTLEWTIGNVDDSNSTGSFEFEAQAEDEVEFFPMSVAFSKSKPFVDVDVRIFEFMSYVWASTNISCR